MQTMQYVIPQCSIFGSLIKDCFKMLLLLLKLFGILNGRGTSLKIISDSIMSQLHTHLHLDHQFARLVMGEYFRQPSENFKTCNPVKWWSARISQFPDLSQLARDLLSIPGSAVTVERIFSGGRDH